MGRGREGARGDTAPRLNILKRPFTRPVGHYSRAPRRARFTVMIKVSDKADERGKNQPAGLIQPSSLRAKP